MDPVGFRSLPERGQDRTLAEIKERFGLAPEDVTEAYLDDRGSVRGVARLVKDENGQVVVEYAAADLVLDYLGETPADA